MDKIKIAFQMIGIGELDRDNLCDAIKKLAEIGYEGVEFAGYHDCPMEEIKEALDINEVKAVSSHVDLKRLDEELPKVIKECQVLSMENLAIPGLDVEYGEFTSESIDNLTKNIKTIAQKCTDNGINLSVHACLDTFDKDSKDRYLIDAFMEDIPNLNAQIDTIWALIGGVNPENYIRKFAGRTQTVHYKDIAPPVPKSGSMKERWIQAINQDIEAGYGVQNGPAIVKASVESGAQYIIIEQMGQGSYEESFKIAKKAFKKVKQLIKEI